MSNNKVIIGLLLVTALTIGVVTVMAGNNDSFMGDHNQTHDPSYDHNGYGGMNGNHYGDGTGDHQMLRDGSGAGGMYGNQDGECDYP